MNLASDLNSRDFVGAINPDSLLHVTFYTKAMRDNYKSEKEGRPVFRDITYIKILTPGNQLSEIDTPAREDHKQRFPLHWAAYENSQGKGEQIVGTPLDQWPAISRAEAEELKGIKFFTVEQIAGASDLQSQRLGMNGNLLRQKAKAFLMSAQDSALEQKQAVDIARKDDQIKALTDSIESLKGQVASLLEVKPVLEVKPKRKYTRKNQEIESNT